MSSCVWLAKLFGRVRGGRNLKLPTQRMSTHYKKNIKLVAKQDGVHFSGFARHLSGAVHVSCYQLYILKDPSLPEGVALLDVVLRVVVPWHEGEKAGGRVAGGVGDPLEGVAHDDQGVRHRGHHQSGQRYRDRHILAVIIPGLSASNSANINKCEIVK